MPTHGMKLNLEQMMTSHMWDPDLTSKQKDGHTYLPEITDLFGSQLSWYWGRISKEKKDRINRRTKKSWRVIEHECKYKSIMVCHLRDRENGGIWKDLKLILNWSSSYKMVSLAFSKKLQLLCNLLLALGLQVTLLHNISKKKVCFVLPLSYYSY